MKPKTNLTFFNAPNQLVELLQWTIAIANLRFAQETARLRRCCLDHTQWLEETTL